MINMEDGRTIISLIQHTLPTLVGPQDSSLPGSLPPLLTHKELTPAQTSQHFQPPRISRGLELGLPASNGVRVGIGWWPLESSLPVQDVLIASRCLSLLITFLINSKSIITSSTSQSQTHPPGTPDAPDLCTFSEFM